MNVVITGAGNGIGFELAKKFALESQARVVAISRNRKNLDKLYDEIKSENGKAEIFCQPFDLMKQDIASGLVPFINHFLINVDVLVNNAGLMISKPFNLLSDEDFDSIFSVNVKSVFRLVRDLLPYFSDDAHIVNITSMGGVQGSAKFPGLSLYSASKGALGVLTECMAEEFKEKKIKVNALAIGAVQTEMLSNAFPGYKAPLTAEEMANYIMNFSLTGHHYFNGKIIQVSLSTP